MTSFRGVTLKDGQISYRPGMRKEAHPVAGVRAWVETAGQLDRRLSLTRTGVGAVALGPLGAVLGAIAKKRVDDRQLFLVVEGPGFAWSIDVPIDKVSVDGNRGYARRQQKGARRFAAQVSAAGSSVAVQPVPTYPPPS